MNRTKISRLQWQHASMALAVMLAACMGDAAHPARDTVAHGKPAPSTAAAAPESATAHAAAARIARDSATSPSAAHDTGHLSPAQRFRRATQDSAEQRARAARLPGRSKNDSISFVAAIRAGLRNPAWPVHGPAPLPGALLPSHRIVAFYGNPLSKKMGILGELPEPAMLARLDTIVREWQAADPSTPVMPALQLIVSVAQSTPGKDGMYRQRSDTGLIEKVYGWARARHAVMFLDVQAGRSTIHDELQRLVPFLARPDVHLAVDPEFYMHHNREGSIPGRKIGAMTAADVNQTIAELAAIVTQYHLPPKILVVHRFTTNMLQGAESIRLDPRVQVVINMDGWGQPWLKFDTYRACEVAEPVEYTGFKIFFHNDTRTHTTLLTPREVLALVPRPVYIQYQ